MPREFRLRRHYPSEPKLFHSAKSPSFSANFAGLLSNL